MAEKDRFKKFLETKYFGIVLGILVFVLLFALSFGTIVVRSVELKILDLDFRMKNAVTANRAQAGVAVVQQSNKVSPDIMIVGHRRQIHRPAGQVAVPPAPLRRPSQQL